MKYNKKYDRWFTKDGLVYRYSEAQEKLILCKLRHDNDGYLTFSYKNGNRYSPMTVHRAVFETFENEIPKGMVIDHKNTVRDDNRIENLQCVTYQQNCNNPITLQRNRNRPPRGEFGKKFLEKFGMLRNQDPVFYDCERAYFQRHKVCRWEATCK